MKFNFANPALGALTLLLVAEAAWAAGPSGPEFQVNTHTTASQARPSVAIAPDGNFVVVWDSVGQDGSYLGIFGQRFAASGTPLGGEFQVNSYTTGRQYNPSVSGDDTGNFVVVWESYGQDGDRSGIFAQRFSVNGDKLGGEFQVNSHTPDLQRSPSVAVDPSGSFVVVWYSDEQDGSDLGVFGQRFSAQGVPLGGEFQVNSFTPGDQFYPSVASDPSGDFLVAWESYGQDGDRSGIFAQRFSVNGNKLGGEFRVSSYTTGNQYYPHVAADGSGNFVVVWQSLDQDGDRGGVFGQQLANDGTRIGGEFLVNTRTAGSQYRNRVSATANGDSVVTWSSDDQDGSGFGRLRSAVRRFPRRHHRSLRPGEFHLPAPQRSLGRAVRRALPLRRPQQRKPPSRETGTAS